jgi:hypothetical protein
VTQNQTAADFNATKSDLKFINPAFDIYTHEHGICLHHDEDVCSLDNFLDDQINIYKRAVVDG